MNQDESRRACILLAPYVFHNDIETGGAVTAWWKDKSGKQTFASLQEVKEWLRDKEGE